MKTKLTSLLLALALLSVLCPPVNAASSIRYSDISGHWAAEAIQIWSNRDILQGSEGKFKPNGILTRAELATILCKVLRLPGGGTIFSDTQGKWYEPYINACARQGIYIENEGEAKGNQPITREEAVYMFARAFPVSLKESEIVKTFADMDTVSDRFREDVTVFLNMGFINGTGSGSFEPKGTFTRAQAVTILSNIITDYITSSYDSITSGRVCIANSNVMIHEEMHLEYLIIVPGASMGLTSIPNITADHRTFWLVEEDYTDDTLVTVKSPETDTIALIRPDQRFAGGTGVSDSPYIIKTVNQLKLLDEYCDSRHTKNRVFYFELGNDIQLAEEWKPLGEGDVTQQTRLIGFFGSLDGKGYSISGLRFESTEPCVGLFRFLYGTVKNLTINGDISTVDKSRYINNQTYIGMIASRSDRAIIENCTVNGSVSATSNMNIFVGGLVGFANRTKIYDSTFKGTAVLQSNNVGRSNAAQAGGIVGRGIDIELIRCAVNGEITAIEKGESPDVVAGTEAGGIAGYLSSVIVNDCHSDASVYAEGIYTAISGGIAGYANTIEDIADCTSSGQVVAISNEKFETYSSFAGGIIGRTHAGITRCSSSASVEASGGYFSLAGGVVGHASFPNGTEGVEITKCYATGDVYAHSAYYQNNAGGFVSMADNILIESCFASGQVKIGNYQNAINVAGGFISGIFEFCIVKNCYSTGTVTEYDTWDYMTGSFTGRLEGLVENCYGTGAVTTVSKTGAKSTRDVVIGSRRGNGGRVVNCADLIMRKNGSHFFIYESESGTQQTYTFTEAQSQYASSYTARRWDFDTVWRMPPAGSAYSRPILRAIDASVQTSLPIA